MANEYIAKDYKGSSQPTTLTNAYTTANATIVVADASTFPPGGLGAYFVIVISRGLADEEKMLISTRTGNTLTIVEKGYDGTTQLAHPAGSTVDHCLDAYTLLQANRYVNLQTAKGDLVVRTASTTVRLPIGTDDYALVADLSATNGLAWKQIVTASIANNAVTASKIASGTIQSTQLDSNCITNPKIVDDAVQTSKILNGAVTNSKIGLLAVDTPQLAAGAVTNSKIVDDAVQTSKILNGSITALKLDTDSVITAKILNLNVTTGKIALLAVDTAQLATGAVTAAKIASGTIQSTQLDDNCITNPKIVNDAVQNSKIKDAAVTGPKIYKNIDSFSGATYSVGSNDWVLSHTGSSSTTVTLPNPGNHTGRPLHFRNTVAFTILSASTNVTGLKSPSSGTTSTILSATDGAWCELVSNGSDWVITMSSENP